MTSSTRLAICSFILLPLCANGLCQDESDSSATFLGNWAIEMPSGQAGWLSIALNEEGQLKGELWSVGANKKLTELRMVSDQLEFQQKLRIGKPDFAGGPPTGERLSLRHLAKVTQDKITVRRLIPVEGKADYQVEFSGIRLPPVPPKPNLEEVEFGAPIQLFDGRTLNGWRLTNEAQINAWKVIDGELANKSPKKDFSPFARYGNLRTEAEFGDFNLKLDFNVPQGGNSGVYLRGLYEAQVVDRDSPKMQGIQGVGAIFGRIEPTVNAGKVGGQWQTYDITLVDRHITVILNGQTVIDNQPVTGCTNGALFADETREGPIFLQGDHTEVRYRNIVLKPVLKKNNSDE